MKGRANGLFVGILSVILLITMCGVVVFANAPGLGNSQKSPTEEEVLAGLMGLDKKSFEEELQNAFYSKTNANDINALIPWATALAKRVDEFSKSEMEGYISDNALAEPLRITFVQLFAKTGFANDNLDIIELLEKDAPTDLKNTIITHLDFTGPEQKKILERVVASGDDKLIYNALKEYERIDSESAGNVARGILEDSPNASDEQKKAAVYALAEHLTNHRDSRNADAQNRDKELIRTVA